MFIRNQRFQISDGVITAAFRAGLTATWGDGLTVDPQLPATKTRRMVIVRDDSGPVTGRVQARRQGVNVWAESRVQAQNLALDVMQLAGRLPNGIVIAGTSGFVGPYEVPDEAPYAVGGVNLSHYFLSFIADVKAI